MIENQLATNKQKIVCSSIVMIGMVVCAFSFFLPFHIDEYYDILAAQMIWEKGLPKLPSGSWWTTGGLITYLESIFVGLFGPFNYAVRLPNFIFSMLSILLLIKLSRKFGTFALMITTLFWIFDPTVMRWSAYARQYAIFPFLTFLVLYLCDSLANRNNLFKKHVTIVLSLCLCIWCHALTVLWVPAFILYYLCSIRSLVNPYQKIIFCLTLLFFSSLSYLYVSWADSGLLFSSGLEGGLIKYPHNIKEFIAIILSYKNYFLEYPQRIICTLSIILLCFLKLKKIWPLNKDSNVVLFEEDTKILIFFFASLFSLSVFKYSQPGYPLPLLGVLFILGGKVIGNCLSFINKPSIKFFLFGLMMISLAPGIKQLMQKEDFNPFFEASNYIASHYKAEDAIIGPNAYLFLKLRENNINNVVFYHYCVQNCGLSLIQKSGKTVDRFFSGTHIAGLNDLPEVFSKNDRVWWILNPNWLKRNDRYPEEINNYLFKHMRLIHKVNDIEIYLYEKQVKEHP